MKLGECYKIIYVMVFDSEESGVVMIWNKK